MSREMSRRRRGSSVASRTNDGEESDSAAETPTSTPSGRKRKRPDPVISASEMCQQLYDTIRAFKKDDGTLLCDSFIRAPKRRQEPQYYEVVTQPIDLLRVQQKLKTDTYEDIEELASDIELLVNNAKAFYKPYTAEYKDAVSLWNLFHQTRQSLENGDEQRASRMSRFVSSSRKSTTSVDNAEGDLSETSTITDDDNVIEELFTTVMAAQENGRLLHQAFLLLPSKRRFPMYYEVIDYPIDLKSIAMKIQSGEYSALGDLEKDLVMMTRNACHFNEPGSQIYKDAKTLKKTIQTKKQELDAHVRAAPAKTSERIRRRVRAAPGQLLASAAVAILAHEEEEGEEEAEDDDMPEKEEEEEGGEEEDSEEEDDSSPHRKLFDTIKNYLGPNGMPLSDPFWKLPSKRVYPKYYREIKNPMCLNQIRQKIRLGQYGTVSEVAGDMNIMFENAKRFNVHTSKLYRNAARLQRLMQQKVQELLEIVQDTSSDDESLSSVKTFAAKPRGRPRVHPLPAAVQSPVINTAPAPVKVYSNPNKPNPTPLKKKLHALQRHLLDLTCSDGRQPMLLFMEKPSKKLYPDYYGVIHRPIDMLTIEANIKNDRYTTLEEIISDFKLMFSNCRQYNEEGSMIYEDANMLEKALNEKVRELSDPSERLRTPTKPIKMKAKQLTPIEQKLRTLYDAIRDYRDQKNRQLALIFMKLPNKLEYPDYYELIKSPIDMERIAQKLKGNGYESVTELASDFILMFDNACKYNEPDSQIYKDALILQRVCLQTKQLLREGEEAVPDVALAVQEILMSLFTTVYNHQDEEGRCYSDSLAELPEHDEVEGGGRVRAISMDLIKRRLDKGLYKRLDHFQEDMFAIWDRARRLSRTDSQVFEDSLEMQSCFISTRDQVCGGGGVLQSPALAFSRASMAAAVDALRQRKLLQENLEEDNETRSSSSDDSMMPSGGAFLPQTQYNKGDYVYVSAKKAQTEPSILQIERIWTNADDVAMVYGNCYFRPFETYHVTTRRFLENEVFKTDTHTAVPLSQVTAKCYIMNVKEYFKLRPEGFADKDVYVCESRYSTRSRAFKKIKVWPEGAARSAEGEGGVPALVPRDAPLEPKRVSSVFRDRIEKHKDELAELDILENMQERERPDVVLGTEADVTYYCQYNTVCSGLIKTGDYVYVVTEGGRQMIAQVDTIWETKDNKCYFRGPFLIFPSEVASIVNKAFYKQEALLTTVQDSSPLVGIVGKCAVLHYDDYLKCRPTEIQESDVFVCESMYDDATRIARKLKTGLKKYDHPKGVTVDEVYTFSRPLGPPQLASTHEMAAQQSAQQGHFRPSNVSMGVDSMDSKPQFTNLMNTALNQEMDMLLENSMDESSMSSPAIAMHPTQTLLQQTPLSSKKSRKKKDTDEEKKKVVTGYILYSSEVRKAITASNPESTFGEISRLVGNEWRSLPAAAKISWEERAAKCNEIEAARIAESLLPTEPVLMEFVYECLWEDCDFQFEDLSDVTEHCIGETGAGHIQQYCQVANPLGYACMWRGCHRKKRGQPPFPNAPRLSRHIRDLHINKGNGRHIPAIDKSKNFKQSSKPKPPSQMAVVRPNQSVSSVLSPIGGQISPHARNTPSPSGLSGGAMGNMSLASTLSGKPTLEPLFVAAPPRPQRVQHSEAYIRYIEGLHSEQKYISPWEKTTVQPPPNPDPSHYNLHKLPVHWLSEEVVSGYGHSEKGPSEAIGDQVSTGTKVLKALWALRDFMMKDAMCLHKNA